MEDVMVMEKFKNATYLDFTKEEIFNAQKEALNNVRARFGQEYPNIINGEKVYSEKKTISVNPANPDEKEGIFQKSGKEDAENAIQAADKAFQTWKNVPAEERASYLFRAAEIVRRRRLEINAWMISEVGKNYLEADADTCEAIDFLEFYGREAIRYAQPQELTQVEGERAEYFYIPLGVGLCIPPWNFPFAIMIGISSAAIAAGNTVVLKPSSDAPMMAWLFAEIMMEAGLPEGVLNYFVASGAEAGDYLVQHPKTRFISFTGSKEVGLRINELAAKMSPGQIWIKRVVAEMGGKDALVVDSEADVDMAVTATVTSAFGFQGQKCSACSRVIVDQKVYDEFVNKLQKEVAKLEIGDPKDNKKVGPVVSDRAYKSILNYIKSAKAKAGFLMEATLLKELTATLSSQQLSPTFLRTLV
jgi:1-pyrroline-5-carboxylate dehydrogenase